MAVLQAFAKTLEHEAAAVLERPFVHYVATNLPQKARDHFYGLHEAKKNLVGVALFDRIDKNLQQDQPLVELMWRRREAENYFCSQDVLLAYALHNNVEVDDLFSSAERDKRIRAMTDAIREVSDALRTLNKPDPWSPDIKASDDFLEPLFRDYFKKLDLPLELRKSECHVLASLVPREDIDPEIAEKLAAIVRVARQALPANA